MNEYFDEPEPLELILEFKSKEEALEFEKFFNLLGDDRIPSDEPDEWLEHFPPILKKMINVITKPGYEEWATDDLQDLLDELLEHEGHINCDMTEFETAEIQNIRERTFNIKVEPNSAEAFSFFEILSDSYEAKIECISDHYFPSNYQIKLSQGDAFDSIDTLLLNIVEGLEDAVEECLKKLPAKIGEAFRKLFGKDEFWSLNREFTSYPNYEDGFAMIEIYFREVDTETDKMIEELINAIEEKMN